MKIRLNNVTLLGIDCVNPKQLLTAINIYTSKIDFESVKILSSENINDSRLVKIPKISSMQEYSLFCLKDLYKYVETDFVLLIQWDGFILNPESWTDEFLNYDYIGAPWVVKDWSINDFGFPEKLRGTRVVGNGGFCIRSRKFLEVSSRLYKYKIFKTYHPEDIAVSVWYRDLFIKEGIKFAPVELARKFAIEGGDDVYHNQFGFHGFYTDLDKWMNENKQYMNVVQSYYDFKKNIKKYWKPDEIVI
ncbi:MAG TPA: DUF5672 family protein [Parcubacteria group bacterium]|jgi:hypothetical protein|nr:DUF5672 family protein [Parcubacteria group bacterium]